MKGPMEGCSGAAAIPSLFSGCRFRQHCSILTSTRQKVRFGSSSPGSSMNLCSELPGLLCTPCRCKTAVPAGERSSERMGRSRAGWSRGGFWSRSVPAALWRGNHFLPVKRRRYRRGRKSPQPPAPGPPVTGTSGGAAALSGNFYTVTWWRSGGRSCCSSISTPPMKGFSIMLSSPGLRSGGARR